MAQGKKAATPELREVARKASRKKWRQGHPKQEIASKAKYRKDNPEKVRECQRKCDAKRRERNPEEARAKGREYAKNNRVLRLVIQRKREALKLNQMCACCTDEQFKAIYDVARWFGCEVDHKKPLALGGLHCRSNLQMLEPEQHKAKTKQDLRAIRAEKRRG